MMGVRNWDDLKSEMEGENEAFDSAELLFSGRYLITREWEMVLPDPLRREIRNDRVLLWRPNLTLWLEASDYNEKGSMQVLHDAFLAGHKKNSFMPPVVQERSNMLCGACTLMVEDETTKATQPIFSGWVAGPRGFVTMQMYYINMRVDDLGWLAWESIRPATYGAIA